MIPSKGYPHNCSYWLDSNLGLLVILEIERFVLAGTLSAVMTSVVVCDRINYVNS